MALQQTSIGQYFSSRKRQATDPAGDAKLLASRKVLILDENVAGSHVSRSPDTTLSGRKILAVRPPSLPRKTPVSHRGLSSKTTPHPPKPTAKKSLFSSFQRKEPPASGPQDLGLSEIKAKLSRSSKLGEMREALERLKQGHDKLLNPQPTTPIKESKPNPSLRQFESIQLEVPTSPSKALIDGLREMRSPSKLREALFKSPVKMASKSSPLKSPPSMPAYTSPRKLLEDMGSAASATKSPPPAYQRYYNLVVAGKPALVLPYKYRVLAELFRSVDTAASMMGNRNETVTFTKLKQPVLELCKKNLTETQLAQIRTVLPDAFKFTQEKVHQFGQTDKYHLVLTPTVAGITLEGKDKDKNERELLTPSILLERKRLFYQGLLEKVKDHHEIYLRSLDPPMVVSRDKLTRWHPEFDIHLCPDIEPTPLPQPPNTDKCSTARDVLNKARDMFVVNPRMEKALQRLSENNATVPNQPVTTAAAAIPALANALKGIPKSLLEKVRARQAAKAMELLTRNPAQTKTSVELSRLPELSRILRNLFVGEKKNVLHLDTIVTKLSSSYREILTPSDMEHHLELIINLIPGWLTFLSDKKYLRMAKDKDMVSVMKDLEDAIAKN